LILNPAIIALLTGSFLISGFAVYAAGIGIQILRHWDLKSGSEYQLVLERKTYLISTVLGYLLAFELFSLFMFVYTADYNRGLFIGAMCAAGSLNVNAYGYPTLNIKIINFILCSIWLVLNFTDNRAHDYPLIRTKYKFLPVIAVFLIFEALLQTHYFTSLRADVITSCCGALFSEDTLSAAGEIAGLPPYGTLVFFFLSILLTLRAGVYFYFTGKMSYVFGYLSTWMFFLGLIAIISVISVFFYELPTHHCPFCILQKEYHFIGYPIYLTLFTGGIFGMSVAVIDRFKRVDSLKSIIPELQKKLCMVSMSGFIIFTLIVTYPMIFCDFKLFGY
jgi:hypothetical protein